MWVKLRGRNKWINVTKYIYIYQRLCAARVAQEQPSPHCLQHVGVHRTGDPLPRPTRGCAASSSTGHIIVQWFQCFVFGMSKFRLTQKGDGLSWTHKTCFP